MRLILYMSKTDYKDEINRRLMDSLLGAFREDAELRHETSLKGAPPTLVHVFGCWNRTAADMIFKAHRRDIPTVYSPLGGLMPWNLKDRKYARQLKMLSFQRQMTIEARALLAFGKLEAEQLLEMKWNNRTQFVENPFITNQISEEGMIQKIRAFYQKVLDSNSSSLLDRNTLGIIGGLLQASLDKDAFLDESHKTELLNAIRNLKEEDWRTILLYASDELIINRLLQGISYLKIQAPDIPLHDIDRFAPNRQYTEQPIAIEGVEPEKELAKVFKTLYNEVNHDSMPLSHLADLYKILRFTDYDENEFEGIIRKGRQEKFAARILGAMADILNLTEGFMPISPINDGETGRLIKNITKIRKS